MTTPWSELPGIEAWAQNQELAPHWGDLGAILGLWTSQPRSAPILHIDIPLRSEGCARFKAWNLPMPPLPLERLPDLARSCALQLARLASAHLSISPEASLLAIEQCPIAFRETVPLGPFDLIFIFQTSLPSPWQARLSIRRLTRVDEPRALAFCESKILGENTRRTDAGEPNRRLSI